MSSSRLPGKVLLDIAGESMLAHVVQSAGRTLVIFAGGERGTADEVVAKASAVL